MNNSEIGVEITDKYYERGKITESEDGSEMLRVGEWITPRYQAGSVTVSIKSALEHLECTDAAKAVKFVCAGDCDILGRVHRKKMDGRVHKMARSVKRQGGDYRVALPPEAIDHIPYTMGEIKDGDVNLDVWAVDDPDVIEPCLKISPHMVVEAEMPIPAEMADSERESE